MQSKNFTRKDLTKKIYQDLGFSKKELAQVACNGFQIALIDETQRNAYESELNDYLTDFELN